MADNGRFLRRAFAATFRAARWNLGVVHHPIHRFLEPGFRPEIHWLPAQRRHLFGADPFGVWTDDELTIVFEMFDYRSERGSLAAVTTRDGRTFSKPEEVMRLDTHLSYPFLLEHEGTRYCVPENAGGGAVVAYTANPFPNEWSKHSVLIEGFGGLDSTIFQRDGRWWLFATDADRVGDEALHVFHSDRPLGPWEPHSRNPVKVDAASARPAGTVFEHEGRQYRPSQDSSSTYRGALVIHEILELTPDAFAERAVHRIDPWDGAYPSGFHTISAAGDWTLVDGKKWGFVPSEARRRIARKLARARPRAQ